MPTGIIINSLAIISGGLLGSLFGNKISPSYKENLNMLFGLGALAMGITSIILVKNLPVIILALIIGTIIGMALDLSKRFDSLGAILCKCLPGSKSDSFDKDLLCTAIVLFSVSGTGIYGSLVSGMTGEHTILIAKSILDFFTAMIFACTLGKVTMLISLPQFNVFLLLFFSARFLLPITTPSMIDDFKACGGLLLIATGLRILKIKAFPIADMIPAMIVVFPFSALWTNIILPLL